MTKLFYCKSCEAEGDDISPYSRTAMGKAVVEVSVYIHRGSVHADTTEECLNEEDLMPDSYVCNECDQPVQLVDIDCPHDWKILSSQHLDQVSRRCELCGVSELGRAIFDA